MVTISSEEAAEVAGITYRLLDYWCRIGLIPGKEARGGSGSRRRFTSEQVTVCRLLDDLIMADRGRRSGDWTTVIMAGVELAMNEKFKGWLRIANARATWHASSAEALDGIRSATICDLSAYVVEP